jgi:hypothetical protein
MRRDQSTSGSRAARGFGHPALPAVRLTKPIGRVDPPSGRAPQTKKRSENAPWESENPRKTKGLRWFSDDSWGALAKSSEWVEGQGNSRGFVRVCKLPSRGRISINKFVGYEGTRVPQLRHSASIIQPEHRRGGTTRASQPWTAARGSHRDDPRPGISRVVGCGPPIPGIGIGSRLFRKMARRERLSHRIGGPPVGG